MKIKIKYTAFTFILCLLLIWSCRKKEYPPSEVENDPVYYTSVTINGEKTILNAGENNYYMFSSNSQDSNGLVNYLARLQPQNCNNCPKSLSFQINNFRADRNFMPDSSLTVRTYDYFSYQDPGRTTAIFNASYSGGAATESSYNWDFGDGQTAQGSNVTHIYSSGGPKQVCLQVFGSNKCVGTNCNTIDLDPGALNAFVSSISNGNRSAGFSAAITGGTAPYSCTWDFGDGTIKDTSNSVVHQFPYTGAYAITLKVRDAKGATTVSHYNYKTLNDNSSCTANMLVTVVTPTAQQAFENKARITWTDDAGTVFSSDQQIQSPTSYFEVLSSEDAGTNENGEKIRKLKIKFAATLFNGSRTVKLENGEAVIAVSYK